MDYTIKYAPVFLVPVCHLRFARGLVSKFGCDDPQAWQVQEAVTNANPGAPSDSAITLNYPTNSVFILPPSMCSHPAPPLSFFSPSQLLDVKGLSDLGRQKTQFLSLLHSLL